MTDATWRDSELAEAENQPNSVRLSGLSDGDSMTVTFHDDGEMVDTEYGEAVVFSVKVENPDGSVPAGEGDLMTSSKRFLSALSEEGDIVGATYEVTREGESYDTQYDLAEK